MQIVRILVLVLLAFAYPGEAAERDSAVFSHDELVAWCIVPYDGKQRSPEDRAAMLEKLGIHRLAYDYRTKHLPSFEEELAALDRHHVELFAVWFPDTLNADARFILDVLKKHKLHPQLWVASYPKAQGDDGKTVEFEVNVLRPVAAEAQKLGCTIGLYNHGGWFGVPENQMAIIHRMNKDGITNIGMVYNLHHAHDDMARLSQILPKMKPHLLALTLNGMADPADKSRLEILPIGYGAHDLTILKAIRDAGYSGPFAILNHTNEDAELRLQDNLDGLDWLVGQLEQRPSGDKPRWRTNPLAQPTN
jgi:sugar phosphate isomerase/epimerase